MFKILVVDDEEKIREVIKTYGEYNGHKVLEAVDGLDAIEKVKESDFDIIVMDIMMPKLDGFTAYKEIKKIKDIPVIMLSARSEEYDKLFGFEVGADDYVVKPFSPKELMARINVIVNRNRKGNVKRILDVEGLHIDLDGRTVSIDGEKIDLTPKEYDLLVFMIKNKNVALTRNKLLSKVWGYEFYGDDRTVDTHIKMLRNSIKDYRKYIVTVRGVGYKFEEGPLQENN